MSPLFWITFSVVILFMLALDLGVFNRKSHVVRTKEALTWTGIWIGLSLLFALFIYGFYEGDPKQASLQFLTGYLIEKSLSIDNVFVIALVFEHFRTPLHLQHRVLFWGVLGAIVLRFAMIMGGAALMENFSWITYVFGGFLIFTAVKMLISSATKMEPESTFLVRMTKRLFPVEDHYHQDHFFIKKDARWFATRLFLVLVVIEGSDVIFAVDSIPAIFSITNDTFIVFTSNIFAILGLRSLYFALANMMEKFRYLKTSLVFLLSFVGVKMLLAHHYPISTGISLAIICGILAVGVLASMQPKAMRLVLGFLLVAFGLALIPLPGPGLLVVLTGLILLSKDNPWAQQLLTRLKEHIQKIKDLRK